MTILIGLLASIVLAAPTPLPARAVATDPAPLMATAEDAARRGRYAEADRLLRLILRDHPGHDDAYEALLDVAGRTGLDKRSDVYRDTRTLLPDRFYEYETKRFIVLSDSDRVWTQAQAARLEQTYHQFHRFCARHDLRPLPLRHKLVCVLFDDRGDYQQFARDHDDVGASWIAGYYSPSNDRVVFYNVQSNPSVVEARARLREMQDEVIGVDRDVQTAMRTGRDHHVQSLRELRREYDAHIERETKRVESFASRVSISTTTHEAVHMLLFHTRVQSPYVQYPLWICEGLATNFETDDANAAFGPSLDSPARRERFNTILLENRCRPLRELITITDLKALHDDDALVLYHQSYALVHWMCRYRQTELVAYLNAMLNEPSGDIDASRHTEIFESAFGPIDAVERRWLRHERAAERDRTVSR